MKNATNVSNSFEMLCVMACRRMLKPRPLLLVREQVCWIDTSRCLVVILDARLNWSIYVDQFRKKASQRLCVLGGFSP